MIVCFWLVVALLVCLQEEDGVTASSSSFRNHLPVQNKSRFWNRHNKSTFDLQHSYFAIRHGQSKANVQQIIASDPTLATQNYGLSRTGKQQARRAGKQLVQDFVEAQSSDNPPSGIVILTSDFLRAKETARELATAIGEHNRSSPKDPIRLLCRDDTTNEWCEVDAKDNRRRRNNKQCGLTVEIRLRERFFGDYDGTSDDHYHDVWKEDLLDPYHTTNGVESVWSVLDRASSVVQDCEACNQSQTQRLWIVLVAHGDVLQILQTGFCNKMNPKDHRSLPHLDTATLRPLQQSTQNP